MFSINVRNLAKNKLHICKEYHIQPSEIDRLVYYEYEYMIEDINEIVEREEQERKKQEKESGSNNTNINVGSMMRGLQSTISNNMAKYK